METSTSNCRCSSDDRNRYPNPERQRRVSQASRTVLILRPPVGRTIVAREFTPWNPALSNLISQILRRELPIRPEKVGLLGCALLLAVAGCHAPRASAPSLIELNNSLEPLRAHFNDHRDRLRIVALLSPT